MKTKDEAREIISDEIKKVLERLKVEKDDEARKFLDGSLFALRYCHSYLSMLREDEDPKLLLADIAKSWESEAVRHKGRMYGIAFAISLVDD